MVHALARANDSLASNWSMDRHCSMDRHLSGLRLAVAVVGLPQDNRHLHEVAAVVAALV